MGALPRVCQHLDFGENVCQDGHSPRVWVERGRASAIQAIHGMALAGLKAQHASSKQPWQGSQHSRSACSSRHVPGSTRKQDSKDAASLSSCFTFLSTCSKDCGANATFSKVRRLTEPTPSQNGKGTSDVVHHHGNDPL